MRKWIRAFSNVGMNEFLEFERSLMKNKPRKEISKDIPKPLQPSVDECCGRDCVNCIWVVYQENLLDYEAQEANVEWKTPKPLYTLETVQKRDKQHEIEATLAKDFERVKIVENKELCVKSALPKVTFRPTRHIELDLTSTPMHHNPIHYKAADNVAIYVPNSKKIVKKMLNMFALNGEEWIQLVPILPKFDDEMPVVEACSIFDILRWNIDLSTIPRRHLLGTFSSFAKCDREKTELANLASKGHEVAYKNEVFNPQLSVVDVLEKYSTVRPSLVLLLQILPRIAPRYYTISSSPKDDKRKLALTVRILEIETKGRVFQGQCSTYLGDCIPGKSFIYTKVFPSTFRLPKSPTPIIMVGPGTGIAPFRAMIAELKFENRRKSALFFGCQHPEADFLYKQEIESAKDAGHLTNLFVAYSRLSPTKVYVQDLLVQQRQLVFDYLYNQNGSIYICGSHAMGRACRNTLEDIFTQFGQIGYLTKLTKSGRFHCELWTS